MKNKTILSIFVFLLVLTFFPLASALIIGNQTITFSDTSNSTIRFEQNTTLDQLIITENATQIYNLSTDNSIFTNINATYNAQLEFYNLPNKWVVKNLTNNNLLFVSNGITDDYNASILPSSQIQIINDSTNPNALNLLPANNTYQANQTTNFSANLTDGYGLKNATLNIYNSTGDLVETNTTSFIDNPVQYTWSVIETIADGVYSWFIKVFDFAGNSYQTENQTLTIDNTAPIITINSPVEGEEEGSDTIILSITTDENSSCNYSIDSGENSSLETTDNLTFTKSVKLIYGDYSAEFNCVDLYSNSNYTSVNFVMISQGNGGATGGGSSSSSVVYSTDDIETIGDSEENFSQINLEEVRIQNTKLCYGEDKLEFKTLDKNNKFTILDSSKIFINNTEEPYKVFLDLTNEEYYYNLENLEVGEINLTVSANQKGKQVNESVTIGIEKCHDFRELSESNLTKLVNFIRENSKFFFYLCLLIFILGLVSYIVYKFK